MNAIWMACSVCFGDPSSPLSKGILAGVWLLLAVVIGVLGAIAAVAVTWTRRARRLAETDTESAC